MVKFKNLWLFECSEFQIFLNFIIAQYMAEIRTKPESYKRLIFQITAAGPSWNYTMFR